MYPRISWSSLKRYEECPQRYYLGRQKKRKPITEAWVLRGNVLHFALEQLTQGVAPIDVIDNSILNHERMVEEAIDLGWGPSEIEESENKVAHGAKRLTELYAQLDYPGIVSEMRVFKFYQGWCLEGVFDLYAPGMVADLKSGSWDAGQMVFYEVLYRAQFQEPTDRVLVIEPLGRGLVDVVVTEEEIDLMRHRIKDVVEGVHANKFPTTGFPDKCNWCQNEPWCPATMKAREGRLA